MVRYCALCGVKRSKDVSLHVFPAAEEVVAKWKRACGYLVTDRVETLLICSNHFRPDDFVQYTRNSKHGESSTLDVKKLKQNVVPSVNVPHNIENISQNLPQPSEIVIKSEEESFSLKRRRARNVECSLVEKSTLPQLAYKEKPSTSAVQSNLLENEYYASTPIPEDGPRVSTPEVATPQRAKRALFHARYVQINLRDKVRKLQQENFRLKKRISSLQELVKLLKKRH